MSHVMPTSTADNFSAKKARFTDAYAPTAAPVVAHAPTVTTVTTVTETKVIKARTEDDRTWGRSGIKKPSSVEKLEDYTKEFGEDWDMRPLKNAAGKDYLAFYTSMRSDEVLLVSTQIAASATALHNETAQKLTEFQSYGPWEKGLVVRMLLGKSNGRGKSNERGFDRTGVLNAPMAEEVITRLTSSV